MKRIIFSLALAGAMATVGAVGAMAEGRGSDNQTDPRDVASDRGFGMGGNPGQGVRTRTGHNVSNPGHGANGDRTGHGIGLGHLPESDDPDG